MRTELDRQESAAGIADHVRRRAFSAVEATASVLKHLSNDSEATDNAFVTLAPDQALEQAEEVDRRLADGELLPLAGVPISVKDTISTAGVRTTCGSLLLRDWVPERDATAVARLKAAGAIVIGKSNCPEFGNDIQTTNLVHGTTLNPLDQRLVAGGSSGGDAAAVAAGLVPVGIGTDFGGSLRWPAQCTGTVALRPTAGLVPDDGQWGPLGGDAAPANSWSLQGRLQVIGPIARTLEDLALVTGVLTGRSHTSWLSPALPRVHWLEGDGDVPVHSELVAAIHLAVESLAVAGCQTAEAPVDILRFADGLFTRMREMDSLAPLRRLAEGREEQLTPMIHQVFSRPDSSTLTDYLEAGYQREQLLLRVREVIKEGDVLVLPVSAVPAFPVGAEQLDVEGTEIEYWQALTPSRAISLLGLPSVSVPVRQLADGRWASVQIVGQENSEMQLLALSRVLGGVLGHGYAEP